MSGATLTKLPANPRNGRGRRAVVWAENVKASLGEVCYWCGEPAEVILRRRDELDVHHRKPWAKDEEARFELPDPEVPGSGNGTPSCGRCHRAYEAGMLLLYGPGAKTEGKRRELRKRYSPKPSRTRRFLGFMWTLALSLALVGVGATFVAVKISQQSGPQADSQLIALMSLTVPAALVVTIVARRMSRRRKGGN